MTEKVIEIIEGEDGASVLVRPPFPFEAEGFRISGGFLSIFGGGRVFSVTIPAQHLRLISGSDMISLVEFPAQGVEPLREMILSRGA